MDVLAIIPVRGGSKSVPKKNLAHIGGKSLIAHAADCIQKSECITRTVVSTDSMEIAEHARACGLEVPFMRPAELSGDKVTDFPVFHHCLKWLEENENYKPDIVVHIRVTSPFAFKRTGSQSNMVAGNWEYIPRESIVDKVVQMLLSDDALEGVRTVERVKDTPYKMWRISHDRLTPFMETGEKEICNQPRQSLPTVYLQNGYVDVARRGTIIEKKMMYGDVIGACILDLDYLVDIDEHADIELGRLIYNEVQKGQ